MNFEQAFWRAYSFFAFAELPAAFDFGATKTVWQAPISAVGTGAATIQHAVFFAAK
jgi:hypothetical protein